MDFHESTRQSNSLGMIAGTGAHDSIIEDIFRNRGHFIVGASYFIRADFLKILSFEEDITLILFGQYFTLVEWGMLNDGRKFFCRLFNFFNIQYRCIDFRVLCCVMHSLDVVFVLAVLLSTFQIHAALQVLSQVFLCSQADCWIQSTVVPQYRQRHCHTALQKRVLQHLGIYLSSPMLLFVRWCYNSHTSSPSHFQRPEA